MGGTPQLLKHTSGLCAAVLLLAAAGCSSTATEGAEQPDGERLPQAMGIAPDFEAEALTGELIQLSELRGQVVLLQFFSSWSRTSRGMLPQVAKLDAERRDKGLFIIGVALDEPDTVAQLRRTTDERNVRFPVVWDSDTNITRLYNPKKIIPYGIFIRCNGHVAQHFNGYLPGEDAAMKKIVDRELAHEACTGNKPPAAEPAPAGDTP